MIRHNKINKFVATVCEDLGIEPPKITFDITNEDGTMLAGYGPHDQTLHLRKDYENMADAYFSIVHELRHKYQIVHNEFDLENYKTTTSLSIEDYNLQKEEIDANAYGMYFMRTVFGLEPQFNGLSDKVINEIKKREKWIEEKEFNFGK